VELDLNWVKLKIHGVPLARYSSEGVDKLGREIEAENEGVNIPIAVRWMGYFARLKERRIDEGLQSSSAVIIVKGLEIASNLIKKGLRAVGVWYMVEKARLQKQQQDLSNFNTEVEFIQAA
jgi:hypothetical protein